MKPAPKDHPIFKEGPSLVGVRRSNLSTSATAPSTDGGRARCRTQPTY